MRMLPKRRSTIAHSSDHDLRQCSMLVVRALRRHSTPVVRSAQTLSAAERGVHPLQTPPDMLKGRNGATGMEYK